MSGGHKEVANTVVMEKAVHCGTQCFEGATIPSPEKK